MAESPLTDAELDAQQFEIVDALKSRGEVLSDDQAQLWRAGVTKRTAPSNANIIPYIMNYDTTDADPERAEAVANMWTRYADFNWDSKAMEQSSRRRLSSREAFPDMENPIERVKFIQSIYDPTRKSEYMAEYEKFMGLDREQKLAEAKRLGKEFFEILPAREHLPMGMPTLVKETMIPTGASPEEIGKGAQKLMEGIQKPEAQWGLESKEKQDALIKRVEAKLLEDKTTYLRIKYSAFLGEQAKQWAEAAAIGQPDPGLFDSIPAPERELAARYARILRDYSDTGKPVEFASRALKGIAQIPIDLTQMAGEGAVKASLATWSVFSDEGGQALLAYDDMLEAERYEDFVMAPKWKKSSGLTEGGMIFADSIGYMMYATKALPLAGARAGMGIASLTKGAQDMYLDAGVDPDEAGFWALGAGVAMFYTERINDTFGGKGVSKATMTKALRTSVAAWAKQMAKTAAKHGGWRGMMLRATKTMGGETFEELLQTMTETAGKQLGLREANMQELYAVSAETAEAMVKAGPWFAGMGEVGRHTPSALQRMGIGKAHALAAEIQQLSDAFETSAPRNSDMTMDEYIDSVPQNATVESETARLEQLGIPEAPKVAEATIRIMKVGETARRRITKKFTTPMTAEEETDVVSRVKEHGFNVKVQDAVFDPETGERVQAYFKGDTVVMSRHLDKAPVEVVEEEIFHGLRKESRVTQDEWAWFQGQADALIAEMGIKENYGNEDFLVQLEEAAAQKYGKFAQEQQSIFKRIMDWLKRASGFMSETEMRGQDIMRQIRDRESRTSERRATQLAAEHRQLVSRATELTETEAAKGTQMDLILDTFESASKAFDADADPMFQKLHANDYRSIERAIQSGDPDRVQRSADYLTARMAEWSDMTDDQKLARLEAAENKGIRFSKYGKDTEIYTEPTIEINGEPRPTTNSNGDPIETTEEELRNFYAWFGNSEAVDEEGRPIVLYHGTTRGGFTVFDPDAAKSSESGAMYFSTIKRAATFAGTEMEVPIAAAESLVADPERASQFGFEIIEDPETGFFEIWRDGDFLADDLMEDEAVEEIDLALEEIKDELMELPSSDFTAEHLSMVEYLLGTAEEPELDTGREGEAVRGLYPVYLKIDNMGTYDFEGNEFIHVPEVADEELNADELADELSTEVEGLRLKNVKDAGELAFLTEQPFYEGTEEDTYVVFESTQIKSATENIGTYDPTQEDIRYSKYSALDEENLAYQIAMSRKLMGRGAREEDLAKLFPDPEFDLGEVLRDVEEDAKDLITSKASDARKAAMISKRATERSTRGAMRAAAQSASRGELARMRQEERVGLRTEKGKERAVRERGLTKQGVLRSKIDSPVQKVLDGTLVDYIVSVLQAEVKGIDGAEDTTAYKQALQGTLRKSLEAVAKTTISRKNREGILTELTNFGIAEYRTVDKMVKRATTLMERVQDRSELTEVEGIRTKMLSMINNVLTRKATDRYTEIFKRKKVSYRDAMLLKSIARAIKLKQSTGVKLADAAKILVSSDATQQEKDTARADILDILPEMSSASWDLNATELAELSEKEKAEFEEAEFGEIAMHIAVTYASLLAGDKDASLVMDSFLTLEQFLSDADNNQLAEIAKYQAQVNLDTQIMMDSLGKLRGKFTGLSKLASAVATPLQFLQDTLQATESESPDALKQFERILAPFINARGSYRGRQIDTETFLTKTIETVYTDRKAYRANSKRHEEWSKWSNVGKAMTKWELMNLVLMLENGDVQERAKLGGNRGLKTQLAQLEDMRKELTAKDVEYMDALRAKLAESFPEIARVFKERFGSDLTQADLYFPIVQYDAKGGALGGAGAGITLIRSFLKERVPNTNELHTGLDINLTFIQHLDSVNRFLEYYDAQLLSRDVLLSSKVLSELERTFGITYRNRFAMSIADEVNGVSEVGAKSPAIKFMRWATITLSIPFNIFSGLRQIVDTPSAGAALGWKFFPSMVSQFSTEGQEARLAIANHPAFRADMVLGGHPELVLQYKQRLLGESTAGKIIHYVKDIVRNTDSFSRWLSAGAVLQVVRQSPEILAISDPVKREQTALNYTVRQLQENLQSPMESDRPILARKAGDAGKLLTTFTSALTPKVAAELVAINKAITTRNGKDISKAASRLAYYHILSGGLQYLVYAIQMSGADDDDDEGLWQELMISMLLGPFAGLPLFGRGLEQLAESTTGRGRYGGHRDPTSMVWSTADGLAKAGYHLTQAEWEEAWEKGKKTLIHAAAIGRVSKNLIERFQD